MSLEEEIKTSKFSSEAQKAYINVLFTASWFKRRLKAFFDKHDITMEQFNVLRIVRGAHIRGGIRVIDISNRMVERSSNTTRIIDKLEKKNLVERTALRADKRALNIQMTQVGLDFMHKIDKAMEESNPHLSVLSDEENELLNILLDKMRGIEE